MGSLTIAQWKELVFYTVFVLSLFLMVLLGGVIPFFKALDERGRWQSEAYAKRWMAELEEENLAVQAGDQRRHPQVGGEGVRAWDL